MAPRLSCIIPAYRRHQLTTIHARECLESSRLPDEIIVVNDGGTPDLREMLQGLSKKCPIIYARIDQDILWNYNGAVNLGFWISRGDYISIEDTDHIPDRQAYENAIQLLSQSELNRIVFKRKVVSVQDVLSKPMAEWQQIKTWGPNQMVSILRREVYSLLKGQDERFCGHYGYMTYDWVHRYKRAGIQSALANAFWAAIGDEGEPGLKRGLSRENLSFYHDNLRRPGFQHPKGILNFTYTIEQL